MNQTISTQALANLKNKIVEEERARQKLELELKRKEPEFLREKTALQKKEEEINNLKKQIEEFHSRHRQLQQDLDTMNRKLQEQLKKMSVRGGTQSIRKVA